MSQSHTGVNDTHDVPKMVGIYKRLFLILTIVTLIGVGVVYLHLPFWVVLLLGFGIMIYKSSVVITSFKHLLVGRYLIVGVFALTLFFFSIMILLTWWNGNAYITGTVDTSRELQMQEGPAGAHHEKSNQAVADNPIPTPEAAHGH